MYSSKKNLEYYSNIRTEYQTQLVNIFKGAFYNGIRTIYIQVKQDSMAKNDKNIMKNFQVCLANIPAWNQEIIDLTANKVIEKTECNYLVKLLEVVYKSNYKLLSSQTKKKKGSGSKNLEIPSLTNFIHKCYCEIARELYINPFLLCDYDLSTWELQSNLRETYRVIENSINNTIRKTLPFEKMIDLYLNDNDSVPSELMSSELSISYSDEYDDEESEKEESVEPKEKEESVEPKEKEESVEPKEESKESKEEVEKESKEEVEEPKEKEEVEELKEEPKEESKEVLEQPKEEEKSVEITVINDNVDKNTDAESLDIIGKEPLQVGNDRSQEDDVSSVKSVEEEIEELNEVLDDELKEDKVEIINNNDEKEDEEEKDDIKKIKIRPHKRSGLLFFEDADSD